MDQQTNLEKDISTLFGFEEMSEEEKGELLNDIGGVIMESATLRFVTEVDEGEAARFEEIVTKDGGSEENLKAALEAFPRFAEILTEEIAAFKSEAASVLSK